MSNLFLLQQSQEFDFNELKNLDVRTICGLKVNVDRVHYDITGTTALCISGTFVVRGIRIRGFWDSMGNPIELKRTLSFHYPKSLCANLQALFMDSDKHLLTLTTCKEINDENKESSEK